jgi:hypothetical protein
MQLLACRYPTHNKIEIVTLAFSYFSLQNYVTWNVITIWHYYKTKAILLKGSNFCQAKSGVITYLFCSW